MFVDHSVDNQKVIVSILVKISPVGMLAIIKNTGDMGRSAVCELSYSVIYQQPILTFSVNQKNIHHSIVIKISKRGISNSRRKTRQKQGRQILQPSRAIINEHTGLIAGGFSIRIQNHLTKIKKVFVSILIQINRNHLIYSRPKRIKAFFILCIKITFLSIKKNLGGYPARFFHYQNQVITSITIQIRCSERKDRGLQFLYPPPRTFPLKTFFSMIDENL